MKHLYERLQLDLESLLDEAAMNENVFVRLESSIKSIISALMQLRTYVVEHDFTSEEEEIYFFKVIKPFFYSRFIYYKGCYSFELRRPTGHSKTFKSFCASELKTLNRFKIANQSFLEYYRAGWDYMDQIYFLRGKFDIRSNPDDTGFDPVFSTSHDYRLSKLMACEMLQAYINSSLSGSDLDIITGKNESRRLKWTGDVINLVELAFGIWLTKQVNGGEANLIDIVRCLESVFQVRIGQPHRRWAEIAQRKRYSFTKFIDNMKSAILQRIDEGLEIK